MSRIPNAVCIVLLLGATVAGQSRTRDGATVGGVAGAVIGGIIGHQNDEVPEGALIGGAVGAIAGGLIGKSQDSELARQRYYQQQAYYQQQQQAYAQQQQLTNAAVSVADVINMSRSKVSETVIISQITSRGVARRLEVSEIISLHQQGVSDAVITAMQQAPLASQTARYNSPSPTVYPREPTIIVHERPLYYTAPPVFFERYYHPHPMHFHTGGSYLRFGF